MNLSAITFQPPSLYNPREASRPQPDGTFRRVLMVDCYMDLQGPAHPASPLAEVVDEALEVAAIHGFEGVVFCGSAHG